MVSDTTPVPFNTIVQWTEKSRRVGIVIVVGERRIAQHRRFRLGGTDGKQHGALAGALQGNCRRQRLPDWDCEANRQPLTPQARYAWCNQYYFATERGRAGVRAPSQWEAWATTYRRKRLEPLRTQSLMSLVGEVEGRTPWMSVY